jgi:hypothetical protein
LLTGPLDRYRPIQLQLTQDAGQRRLFRQYLDCYHYLGYRAPYGAQLRYWVLPAQPEPPPLPPQGSRRSEPGPGSRISLSCIPV